MVGIRCRRFHVRNTELLDFLSESSGEAPAQASGGSDLLTQILLGLRLDGVVYNRCLQHAPWAVAFPEKRCASFHFVSQGGAWLRTSGTDWRELLPGDAVLLHQIQHALKALDPELPGDE